MCVPLSLHPALFSNHSHAQREDACDSAGLIVSGGSTIHWSDRPRRSNLQQPRSTRSSSSQPTASPDGAGSRKPGLTNEKAALLPLTRGAALMAVPCRNCPVWLWLWWQREGPAHKFAEIRHPQSDKGSSLSSWPNVRLTFMFLQQNRRDGNRNNEEE